MGNYRFKLSDMMPNAWFYKLKEMSKKRQTHPKKKHTFSFSSSSSPRPQLSEHRKSYHFTRDLSLNSISPPKTRISEKHLPLEPSRKSSTRRRRRSIKKYRPTQRPVCSCRATLASGPEYSLVNHSSTSDNDSILPEYGSSTPDTFDAMLSCSTSCKCSSLDNDTVDNDNPLNDGFDTVSEHEATKIQRSSPEFANTYGSLSVKVVREDFSTNCKDEAHKTTQTPTPTPTPTPFRRYSSSSSGLKLRTNSPRFANRRIQGRKNTNTNTNSVSESFAVVKSSNDPRRDFRESMVEMIVENNIKASKDLEDLLACYLSLNSDEHHDLIINVFKQIWVDFIHLRLR